MTVDAIAERTLIAGVMVATHGEAVTIAIDVTRGLTGGIAATRPTDSDDQTRAVVLPVRIILHGLTGSNVLTGMNGPTEGRALIGSAAPIGPRAQVVAMGMIDPSAGHAHLRAGRTVPRAANVVTANGATTGGGHGTTVVGAPKIVAVLMTGDGSKIVAVPMTADGPTIAIAQGRTVALLSTGALANVAGAVIVVGPTSATALVSGALSQAEVALVGASEAIAVARIASSLMRSVFNTHFGPFAPSTKIRIFPRRSHPGISTRRLATSSKRCSRRSKSSSLVTSLWWPC